MPQPRFTLVLTCLDQVDHLESSLCSILDQGIDNLQLIVVDGSVEDESTAILRHYRHDIELWIRQRCDTMAQAINIGLSRAQGDILGVLTAGDLYLPGTLKNIAQTITADTPWAVGKCQHINRYEERLYVCHPSEPTSLSAFLRHDSGMLPMASSFWHRSVIDDLGMLDETLHASHDYDYACRLIAAGLKPVILKDVLAVTRQQPAAMSAKHTLTQGREYIQIAMRHAHHLSSQELYALLRNCDYRSRIYALAEAELAGDTIESRKIRTLLRRPWHQLEEAIRMVVAHSGHGEAPQLKTTGPVRHTITLKEEEPQRLRPAA